MPGFGAGGHFGVAQQAVVQLGAQAREVDVLADEHQLLTAVADLGGPFAHDGAQTVLVLGPLRPGHEAPPAPGVAMTHQPTGLRPAAGFLVLAGQPEVTLGAQQAAIDPLAVEEGEEALGVEGPARLVGGRGDAVLLGLRHVLATQLLEPARGLGGAVEIEAAGVEDLRQRRLAHHHRHDLGLGIQAAQDGGQLLALGAGNQVGLADQDDVGELHLLDQQVGDRTLIVLAQRLAATGQALGGVEIAQEVDPVDHRHQRIQTRQVGQALALLVAEGEGLGYRQRLADAGGLDQQVVEATVAGQPRHFLQQVFAQGAADAAVAHLHQLLVGTVEADVALHFAAVDVDFTHVVDDQRHAQAVAVLQHVVEQGALAGAEKARQHGDG